MGDKVKEVVHQIELAEQQFSELSTTEQQQVVTVLDGLRVISDNLLQAACYGSKTANKLAQIAHKQIEQVDINNPMDTAEALQAISALNKLATEAGRIGLDLIKANAKANESETRRKVFLE